MMNKLYFRYILFLLFVAVTSNLYAQVPTDPAMTTSVLEILKADRYNFEKRDTSNFISLAGNVVLRKENTLFYCDSAVLDQKQNVVEAFGKVHINDADSVHTYADYMRYVGKEKKAYLRDNVRLTDNKGVLTTNALVYELDTKIGTYKNGGRIVQGSTTLTSIEGIYYGDTQDMYFYQKVVLKDPEYNVFTDTLLYNMNSEVATFLAKTKIVGKDRTIETTSGYYDKKNGKTVFSNRSSIIEKDYELTADRIAFDNKTGFGQAQGNAVYRTKDTANRTTVIANDIKFNRNASSFLATLKPLMIMEQNNDSIFIAADTLYSAKLSDLRKSRQVPEIRDTTAIKDAVANKPKDKDSSSNRFFEAYFHVRIFSDSMQAVADSLFYSLEDSAFRLFKQPVVWSDDNQITGDTIYLYTQYKKPKRLYVYENALAISKVQLEYFNQVRGNSINGHFKEGNIDNLRAKGSAESIYYAVDEDDKFIGVNKSSADVIDMFFTDKKPQRVVFRNDLKGTTYPMRQVDHVEIRLRGFQWLEEIRPKTWQELLQ
jgi:lipopolysaccharide export system protein LptA